MTVFGIISLVFALTGFIASILLLWRIPSLRSSNLGPSHNVKAKGIADISVPGTSVPGTSEPGPRISVIIPARNEEKNIAKLLKSIAAQSVKPFEIIVADDGSTDGTAGIANEYGARVVSPGTAPTGWIGKSWASYSGALVSGGELLIFLDADTELSFDSFEQIALQFREQRKIAVSVQPYHRIERFYETLSLFFNIILMKGIDSFGAFKKGSGRNPSGLFGPVMAIRRNDYFSVDGHASVKSLILEDVELGKVLLRHGFELQNYSGKDTINFRMYPGGFRDLVEGWSKNFVSGAASSRAAVLAAIILWISGCCSSGTAVVPDIVSSIAAIGKAPWTIGTLPIWSVMYCLYAAEIYWHARRIGNFPIYCSIFFPVYSLFFIIIFMYSTVLKLVNGKVRWKGRTIDI